MSLDKKRGEQEVNVSPPDTIGSGGASVAVAGTAVPLSATSILCRFINIYALATNTGNVFYGGTAVSSTSGGVLEQARDSGWFAIDDVAKVYIDCEAGNTDGVQFIYTV